MKSFKTIKNLASLFVAFTISFFVVFSFSSLAQTTESGETGDEAGTTYTLLQPLNSDGSTTTSIDIKSGGLSAYLQTIFQYLLVVVTIIAIFMLMYGGMEYLTTDIVNRKSAGKETILRALSGIIFIFCIWFILNIINPDLTKTTLDLGAGVIDNSTASVTTIGASTKVIPVQTINTCPEGIVSIGSAQVCRSIVENVQKLFVDAGAAGINLTISGSWRPPERQIALRKQNCGTTEYDIYQKPSGQCSPPTAIPGTSNHEKGLALDLGVGGASFCYNVPKTESVQTACASANTGYKWLKANASKYGLYNNIPVTKEAWHWSTNGK